jgi:2'-5' RNA ligase
MRLFVCTLLASANQAIYGRTIGEIIAESRGLLRAIPTDSAHLTYAFLPHVVPSRIDDISAALASVAARHLAISIQLGMPFVLTGGSEARLICAPVTEGAARVQALVDDVAGEISRRIAGVELRQTKSLHVTLARFRKGTRGSETRGIARTLEADALVTRDTIAQLQLMESRLSPTGPIYTVVRRKNLESS